MDEAEKFQLVKKLTTLIQFRPLISPRGFVSPLLMLFIRSSWGSAVPAPIDVHQFSSPLDVELLRVARGSTEDP